MAEQLIGHWRHSHEEDEANDIAVFRPVDFPFPPSRGRAEFELLPDGQACLCGSAVTTDRKSIPVFGMSIFRKT